MTSGEAFARLLTVALTWADAGEMVGRARDVQVLGWEALDLGADTGLKKPLLRQLFAACGVDPMAVSFTADELGRAAPFGPKAYGRRSRSAASHAAKELQNDWAGRWPKDALVPIHGSVLDEALLPISTKKFLQNVGLPQEADFLFGENFALSPFVANTQGYPSERLPLLSPMEHASLKMLLIGYINYHHYVGDSYFCIEQQTGIIRSFASTYPVPVAFFVNEDVRQFAESLTIFHFFMKEGDASMEIEDERARLRYLRKKLRQIDAKAFTTKNAFWPILLREASDQS